MSRALILAAVTAFMMMPQTPVLAQSPEVQRTGIEGVRNMTNQVTRLLQNNMATMDPGCFFDCGDAPRASQSCADAYGDLYSKPVVRMSVTLGYTDVEKDFADPRYNYLAAEDSIRREVWEKKLLRDCGGAVGTCGFKKDADDADRFTKTVTGPDGRDRIVELRLAHSSASYADALNRTSLRSQQEIQTRLAERNFYGGAGSADVWISAGHDRKGGGTTHSPPPLKPGTIAVNFAAFADRAPEKRLLAALRANPNPPKIVARFACDSADTSESELRAATKGKSGVITSASVAEPEVVFAQAYAALDSILAMRCENEFDRAINSVRNITRHDGKGTRRAGFFNDPHPHFQFPDEPSRVPADKQSQTPLVVAPIHPTTVVSPGLPSPAGAGSTQ
jgi:hypothetical protein